MSNGTQQFKATDYRNHAQLSCSVRYGTTAHGIVIRANGRKIADFSIPDSVLAKPRTNDVGSNNPTTRTPNCKPALVEVAILIPYRDSNGLLHDPDRWKAWHEFIGDYTLAGNVQGMWQGVADESREYRIAGHDVEKLAAKAKELFDQQCVYVATRSAMIL